MERKGYKAWFKRGMQLGGIAGFVLMSVPVAGAHDGWTQTNAPIVARGETVYVDLLFGNHSNEHQSYRIDGQWSVDTSKVFVTNAAGKKTDITASRFYTGEPATAEVPAKNNGFIASFVSQSLGMMVVTAEGDSVYKGSKSASRTFRSAKSFVAVSDVPLLQRVASLTRFQQTVTPDRAELVPLFNPVATKPFQEVQLVATFKGKPLANAEVSVIRRGNNTQPIKKKTDEQGKISFTTGPADYYLVRLKTTTQEQKSGEYDTTNYEATMTFVVQKGTATIPDVRTTLLPALEINGVAVTEQIRMRGGQAFVTAETIRKHLQPTFMEKEDHPLRAWIEEQGGVIEYLPAIGAVRPVVVVTHNKK